MIPALIALQQKVARLETEIDELRKWSHEPKPTINADDFDKAWRDLMRRLGNIEKRLRKLENE